VRSLVAAMLAVAVVAAAGCNALVVEGSGNVISEPREVSGVRSVSLSCSGELVITQSGTETLVIKSDDNLLGHITSEVSDGRLSIGLTPGAVLRPTVPMRFELSVDALEGVAVSGSGLVSVDTLATPVMNVAVSGSGDVTIRSLDTGSLAVAISGSGTVSLAGSVDSQSAAISGSGDYDCGTLASRTASVAVSGSGNAVVWVTDKLEAIISGSGSVSYYGDPVIDERVTGSGTVRALGARSINL